MDKQKIEKTNKRIAYLDTIRVIAFLMVIFMHSPIPNKNNPLTTSYLLGGLSYLTYPCIGLFFMVSGALLLPLKMTLKDFLKRRFSRILFPTIIWSFFYIWLKYFYDEIDAIGVLKLIVNIPFGAVEGVLWFMYTLTGLYLFSPIISRWLEKVSKKELQFFLFLWFVVMCFPYFRAFIKIPNSDYNLLSTFSGFMGYMVLGYYLYKFPVDISLLGAKIKLVSAVLIFALILPTIFYTVPIVGFDPGTILYNYLSISVVMMCVGWFVLLQNMNKLYSNALFTIVMKELSVMSFGIYLCHIFVMRRWIWTWMSVGTLPLWLEIVVVALSTFLLSYLIVKSISKLPFGKYVIG